MNNPHKNARTFFCSREQMVERYQNGEDAQAIAAAFGISVRTVYMWLKRFREHGPCGLIARSSAPRTCSNAHMAGWRELIVRLRQLRLTADEIDDPLQSVQLYHYLHEKNADLIPSIRSALMEPSSENGEGAAH